MIFIFFDRFIQVQAPLTTPQCSQSQEPPEKRAKQHPIIQDRVDLPEQLPTSNYSIASSSHNQPKSVNFTIVKVSTLLI